MAIAPFIQVARAQDADPNKITEHDKQVFQNLIKGQKFKARQTLAIMNARQIGLALFEFETEYGSFPNAETAAAVKAASGTKAAVKAETANDCFFQLIATVPSLTEEMLLVDEVREKSEKQEPVERLEKCAFAYLSGMNAAGNPGRPVVVAPLVKGKATFDPQILGGKAVILRVDNSVVLLPIEPDGRVLIDGKDLFDPAQRFWGGKVPPIKWPE